ncbi:uncharacterized protein [Diabrotica undecimpunctata]|uniref:uncharacterized protein n=1 Tax=Diabrotica undecimpunctata TaxID=50387 RepID=UPI003B642238
MPNIGGPSSQKRRMYLQVVQSTLLYGAPIWADVLNYKKYKDMITRAQRKPLLKVTSAYRTTSTMALQVIAGTLPIHLLAKERQTLYNSRDGHLPQVRAAIREQLLSEWQAEWDSQIDKSTMDQKTNTQCDRVVQMSYTYHIRKTSDDNCVICNVEDDAEHCIFRCKVFASEQHIMRTKLGEISSDNLIRVAMESRENFEFLIDQVTKIMKRKSMIEKETERG